MVFTTPFLFCGMLDALKILLEIGLVVNLICLLLGLIKPVLVLWFLDRMNRLKVIQLYGGLTILFLVLCGILELLAA